MAISRYHFTHCTALLEIVPGDCHGPKGPRNDTVVVAQVRNRFCAKQQFISLLTYTKAFKNSGSDIFSDRSAGNFTHGDHGFLHIGQHCVRGQAQL